MSQHESGDVCLVFIHNHRYDANIGKLEEIYAPRFPHRFHLVPFYQGSQSNVISVYESSVCFQGFVAQAARVLQQREFAHYVFVADDLVLNPGLNAGNLIGQLGLDADCGFIKRADSFNFAWQHLVPSMVALAGPATNWATEVPSFAEAATALRARGFAVDRIGLKHFAHGISFKHLAQLIYYLLLRIRQRRKRPGLDWRGFPYPMVCAYSDFFVVPGCAMTKFSAWNGVFAAAGLFAELSIPTTLLLACPRVRFEADTSWRGREVWGEDIPIFEQEHRLQLAELFRTFPARQLYVHPVKLSRWQKNL
jgi:hypothetical protein